MAFSEIDNFPSAVLAHHYPNVPNWGDMTKFKEWPDAAVDVLVGGTPCQSFSVAGLRKGLDDPRGNLALTYLAIAERYRPEWLVWENVPGVLSSDGGRAFGAIIGGMVELGYCPTWRVLDAQYVRTRRFRRAVPQRRRRVFVVAHLGDWRRAAAVLFDAESLRGNPPPGREAGEAVAPSVTSGPPYSRPGNERVECDAIVPECAGALNAADSAPRQGQAAASGHLIPEVANPLTARMHKGINSTLDEGQTALPVGFGVDYENNAHSLDEATGPLLSGSRSGGGWPLSAVAFAQNQRDEVRTMDAAGALAAEPGAKQQTYRHQGMAVRRLTPRECERLQGFPDDFTRIPWRGKDAENCPDGPRYKALGNSMAVNVMGWIGRRIQRTQELKA